MPMPIVPSLPTTEIVLSTCHCFGLFVTTMASKEDIQQLVKQMSDRISFLEAKSMLIYFIKFTPLLL